MRGKQVEAQSYHIADHRNRPERDDVDDSSAVAALPGIFPNGDLVVHRRFRPERDAPDRSHMLHDLSDWAICDLSDLHDKIDVEPDRDRALQTLRIAFR